MATEHDGPIPLDEEDLAAVPLAGPASAAAASGKSSKIQAFGAATARARAQQEFKRPLNLTGAGATRCRAFNSKITIAAIDHMVNQINEWLDTGDIEVKHVNQVVGVMEGKTAEPNVIVTVWY